jgi:hypothetical protein
VTEKNGDNLEVTRRGARSHFSNEKREYLKEKINELASNGKEQEYQSSV